MVVDRLKIVKKKIKPHGGCVYRAAFCVHFAVPAQQVHGFTPRGDNRDLRKRKRAIDMAAKKTSGKKPKRQGGGLRFVTEFRHYRTGKLMRARDYGYRAWPLAFAFKRSA